LLKRKTGCNAMMNLDSLTILGEQYTHRMVKDVHKLYLKLVLC
jgi:hypothetical protein